MNKKSSLNTQDNIPTPTDFVLRDDFAKYALMGFLARNTHEGYIVRDVAMQCYQYADAMLLQSKIARKGDGL